MKFDELQQLWCQQENVSPQPIDHMELKKLIDKRKSSAENSAAFLEMVLVIINGGTGISLLYSCISENKGIFAFLFAGFMLLGSLYFFSRFIQRRRAERKFDRSMAGELEHAITTADYILRLSRTILFWYGLPLLILGGFALLEKGVSAWALLGVFAVVALSFWAGQWEIRKFHSPRKQRLLELREQLMAQ